MVRKSWPLKSGKHSEHLNSYFCEYTASKALPIRSIFVGQAGFTIKAQDVIETVLESTQNEKNDHSSNDFKFVGA